MENQSGHQHAIANVEGDKFYGAKATINVWEPKIQQANEFSLSQLWVLGGSFGQDLNNIEAGWQVSPDLYGDNNTRLFTYWTSDAYQATGCYYLLCSGFIQVSSDIAMGASISPISSYRDSQYDISILIWKDPKEGHWWMQFGNGGTVMGYWPSFLFSYLADSATMIEWGGEVVNSEPHRVETSQSYTAAILFYSGTTGRVKGVLLTHRNPQYTAVRFFYTIFISLMLGTICWRFGANRSLEQMPYWQCLSRCAKLVLES